MKKLVMLITLVLAFSFVALPAMAQPKKAEPALTPALVCDLMEGGKNLVWSQDGQGAVQKTNARSGHVMIIRALKDAKKIPLAVRQLFGTCQGLGDWTVDLGDDEDIRRAMRFHVREALQTGFDVTKLLSLEELQALVPEASSKK